VDGVYVGPLGTQIPFNFGAFTISHKVYPTTLMFEGHMDDLATFNRVLTAAEIQDLASHDLSAFGFEGTLPLHCYQMCCSACLRARANRLKYCSHCR
jgi:hypothetical protein